MPSAHTESRRLLLLGGLSVVALGLAACATPSPDSKQADWSGRIGITEQGEGGRSFSVGFQLAGNAVAGQLKVLSPLGSVLRQLQWDDSGAWLENGTGNRQRYSNLAELTRLVLGTELPIQALFDWLQGKPSAAQGWEPDLSRHKEGRISATRREPQPAVQLRVILD
jgi:outer membrane lipoprotein LolB